MHTRGAFDISPVTALAHPRTGREFALSRELLGVSLQAVASRLNVAKLHEEL